MIYQVQIPDEALDAAARAAMDDAGWQWETSDEYRRDIWRRMARATIAAALSAWPGGTHRRHDNQEWLDLPLPPDDPE